MNVYKLDDVNLKRKNRILKQDEDTGNEFYYI